MIEDIKKGYITAQNNIVLVQDDGTVEKPKDPKDFFCLPVVMVILKLLLLF